MVLYDGFNNFYGRYSNIERGGKGGLHVNFYKCIQVSQISMSLIVASCQVEKFPH